ncbi:MAG: hypothetical protein H6828_15150 [Planctomycetes bacterium]|nr:hypothetical protein [Planctomycetota bacterium]
MSGRKGDDEVLEVEVERLPLDGEPGAPPPSGGGLETAREVHQVLGPVLAGVLIDLLDAATVSPPLGLVLGLPVGYYLGRQLGLPQGRAASLAFLVGAYCAIPFTFALPVGTLVGVWVRLKGVLAARRARGE